MACRTSRQKREFVRIVRTPTGEVVLDPTGRLAGRGAYLCADGSCWHQALAKGALQRALSTPLPAELKATLEHGAVRIGDAGATITAIDEGELLGQE